MTKPNRTFGSQDILDMADSLPSLQPVLFLPSENPQEDPRLLCILGLSEFLTLKKFRVNGKNKRVKKENGNVTLLDVKESVFVIRKAGCYFASND